MKVQPSFFSGTSNIVTPLKQSEFPVAFSGASRLTYYASLFSSVEINASFYKLPKMATVEKWGNSTPEGFRFTFKVSKRVTHAKDLQFSSEELELFAETVGSIGDKKGCLLVQLPPKFGFVDEPARTFFRRLHELFGCAVAFEARHPSWFSEAATELLTDSGVTRVIADPAAGQPGPHVPTSRDSVYVRLHGTPRIYYSRYSPEYVESVRRELAHQSAAGRSCWCIFDNTAAFEAVPNALQLLHGLDGQVLDEAAILARPW